MHEECLFSIKKEHCCYEDSNPASVCSNYSFRTNAPSGHFGIWVLKHILYPFFQYFLYTCTNFLSGSMGARAPGTLHVGPPLQMRYCWHLASPFQLYRLIYSWMMRVVATKPELGRRAEEKAV